MCVNFSGAVLAEKDERDRESETGKRESEWEGVKKKWQRAKREILEVMFVLNKLRGI